MKHYDILFDGPPSHESGRFVEVNDETGGSICIGEWVERDDGLWALRIPNYADVEEAARDLYDNRLGWSHGRNPYAPPEFWEALRKSLDALKGDDR